GSALRAVARVRPFVARGPAGLFRGTARAGAGLLGLILVRRPGRRFVGHFGAAEHWVRLGRWPAPVGGRSAAAELALAPFGAVRFVHGRHGRTDARNRYERVLSWPGLSLR